MSTLERWVPSGRRKHTMNVECGVPSAGRGTRIAPRSSLIARGSLLALFALALFAGMRAPAVSAESGRVSKPAIVIERSGQCVADTDTMRREHMNLLKHQRDRTVREGVRTTQYSLTGCIECHASSKNNSVAGARDDFCESCHAYVGVRLDCFECHASKPPPGAAARKDARHTPAAGPENSAR